jgi:hypothetical protein
MHEDKIALQIEGIPQHIKPMGFCIVSNKITVDGEKVGYMYREEKVDFEDSGWRFLAGTEEEEYAEDPANGKIFDVNIIAHHDPAIIPYLKMKAGTELERVGDEFVELED